MAALLALALTGTGCRDRKAQVFVERVEVDAEGLERPPGALKPDEAKKIFEQALKADGRYVMVGAEAPVAEGETRARLRAELFVEPPSEVLPRRLLGMLAVQWRSPDGPDRFEVDAMATLPEDPDPGLMRDFAAKLSRELLQQGVLILEALRKPDLVLVKDLNSKDTAVRDAAAQVLVERQRPEVIPELERLLASDDPAKIRRAMGGLVELKARGAVPALIDLARGKDLGFLREVIYALGSIGGEEAEAYLFTVSQGHDQPLIREAADEALAELRTTRNTVRKPAQGEGAR